MKKPLTVICCLLSGAVCAAPVVSDVSIEQDASRKATLKFKLANEPAIVTIDIQTNNQETGEWASIGADKFANLEPNVNGRRIDAGDYALTWKVRQTWPDQRIPADGLRAVVTAWALDNPPDYMAVDLTTKSNVVFYADEAALPCAVTNERFKTDWLLMKRMRAAGIPWRMGSDSYCSNRRANEVPVVVTLSEDYYIGVFEYTQHQYKKIMAAHWITDYDTMPLTLVSYDQARGTDYSWPKAEYGHKVTEDTFMDKIRKLTGVEFDFPTGCQWEFACRGGYTSYYFEGSDTAVRNADNETTGTVPAFTEYAWVRLTNERTDPDIHPVGLKKPNRYGLYDMIGNIWEWCLDWEPVQADFTGDDLIDYPGPQTGTYRMARGGSSAVTYATASSAYKNINFASTRQATDTGFRLACPAIVK